MNNDAINQFVDEVYDDLKSLYDKDRNFQKNLLGREPIKKLFDIYSDWIAYNSSLSPKIVANAIYKDAMGVGYLDFANRKIKKGVQLNKQFGFNLIYGTQKEIDEAMKIMVQLKEKNPEKYDLVLTALEKIKHLSDRIKPAKNPLGKTTNIAKQAVQPMRLPTLISLKSLVKDDNKIISDFIKRADAGLAAQPQK